MKVHQRSMAWYIIMTDFFKEMEVFAIITLSRLYSTAEIKLKLFFPFLIKI